METVKFKGIAVHLDGRKLVVPSLSVKQFEDSEAELTKPGPEDETFGSRVARLAPIMLLAIQRNYPDVTLDNLRDWLDLNTFRETFLAVQGASGLELVDAGE